MGLSTATKNRLILLGMVLFIGCSTQKNAWLNRNFHAMGAYYNTLYNGNLALEQGRQTLIQDYYDNYWEILPVERMQVDKAIDLSGKEKSRNENFTRAEEKATKAIQKHSMLINGVQYNPQMDEAFLLLGKARYYDQRFVPALDAFNYILNRQQDSSTVVPAIIWKSKTQLRMDFPKLALEDLKKLWEQEIGMKEEELTGISATLAQAYIALGKKDSAVLAISRAVKTTKSDEERGRYLYIKGQLYDALGMTDSANAAFDHIIALKRKTPRTYRIHAFMEKIKNFDLTKENRSMLLELLTKLSENRENRPYLDNIYYQLARYYHAVDSMETAIDYYNKSLREQSMDRYLNSRDYLALGNINFDRAQYKEAGAYYDSTLTNLMENTREYRKLKKKRENLDDVILYENIAGKTDSILSLVAMSGAERSAYFTEYTQKIKDQALKKALAAMEAAKTADQNTGSASFLPGKTGNTRNAAGFYFYDATQVAYGKLGFQKIWGDRPLQDNWRTDASGVENKGPEKEEDELTKEAILAGLNSDPQYDPATYIATIPTNEKVIDSLKDKRNFAYYQLGAIYKDKFQEYALAANKLEALLTQHPKERLVLPTKYKLYKIYSITGETKKAEQWKQNILSNHPGSRYAAVILNPTEYKAGKNSPEAVYERLYEKYSAQKFQTVIDSSEVYIARFTGNDIVPKLELLKATAIGRLQGFEAYKEALNFVALTYPLSDEGKMAQKRYAEAIPAMANKEFVQNTPDDDHHLIYVFPKTEMEAAKVLQKKLDKAIGDLELSELSTSIDVYNPEKIFVAVHGLDNKLWAAQVGEKLRKNENHPIDKEFFEISSTNYTIILIHKNLTDYLGSVQ